MHSSDELELKQEKEKSFLFLSPPFLPFQPSLGGGPPRP
jgi:hypothetical protein